MVRRGRLLVLLVGSVVVVACGGTTPSTATGGSGVVKTVQPGSISTNWVQWDKKSCQYVAVTSHPDTWTATLRKPAQSLKIALGEQGESIGQQTDFNNSVKTAAAAAGIQLVVGNYNNPSTTDPVTQNQAMALQNPQGLISYLTLVNVLPAASAPFEKNCIPIVQVTVPYKNVPVFGLSNQDDGKLMGSYLGDFAVKHNWTSGVDILVSQNPAFGADVTDRMTQCMNAAKAKVTNAAVSYLDVGAGTDTTQTATTNWLTAHPNSHHVLACGFADAFAIGMNNAFKAANRVADGAVVGTGGAQNARDLIKAGTSFVATVNQHYDQYGDYLIPLVEDILDGKPVPAASHQKLEIIDQSNA